MHITNEVVQRNSLDLRGLNGREEQNDDAQGPTKKTWALGGVNNFTRWPHRLLECSEFIEARCVLRRALP